MPATGCGILRPGRCEFWTRAAEWMAKNVVRGRQIVATTCVSSRRRSCSWQCAPQALRGPRVVVHCGLCQPQPRDGNRAASNKPDDNFVLHLGPAGWIQPMTGSGRSYSGWVERLLSRSCAASRRECHGQAFTIAVDCAALARVRIVPHSGPSLLEACCNCNERQLR